MSANLISLLTRRGGVATPQSSPSRSTGATSPGGSSLSNSMVLPSSSGWMERYLPVQRGEFLEVHRAQDKLVVDVEQLRTDVTQHSTSIGGLDVRLNDHDTRLNADRIQRDAEHNRLDQGLADVGGRVDGLNRRVGAVNGGLAAVNGRVENLNRRMAVVDQLNAERVQHAATIQNIQAGFDTFRGTTEQRIQALEAMNVGAFQVAIMARVDALERDNRALRDQVGPRRGPAVGIRNPVARPRDRLLRNHFDGVRGTSMRRARQISRVIRDNGGQTRGELAALLNISDRNHAFSYALSDMKKGGYLQQEKRADNHTVNHLTDRAFA